MEYQYLHVERNGHLAVVTFDRPDESNALSWDLMNEIAAAAEEFHEDVQTRVVIFTGKGRHFSVGFDLKDAGRSSRPSAPSQLVKLRGARLGPRMIRSIYEMDQITIAAVNGYALGGGACIAAACDFRIGADNCLAGFPEVNLAMNLSWKALPLVVHLIGPAKAKQMVILARNEKAETLKQWGFLDEVVPADDLMKTAVEMAEAYAAQAPVAAQMVKKSVNAVTSALDQSIMHMDSDQFLYAVSGEDFIEGVSALFEKRKPQFKGN